MKKCLLIISVFFTLLSTAQNNRQNIRGVISDKLSQTILPGATVQLVNSKVNKGTATDLNGNYVLLDLPPDRYEIKVSYIGYKDAFATNVVVTSGKEVVLDIVMEEDLKLLNEVVITSNSKAGTLNELVPVSARTFSTEEVNRYAGGRSDPARLAANFAGVSAPDDSRNDIVIRGNSPVGVLWRIDGMNVTNPNHFATVGTTGGAVSALNTNLLRSSDFLTSAFPAEYGNATAGVFDLGFRNGNTQKRETTLQAGLITGLEATTEGPISKKNASSYLVGYRYALAGVAQAAGIDIGTTALPSYQDLSFNVNSGNTKMGRFTLFGILATSTINIAGGTSGELYGGEGGGHDLSSQIGIIGIKHFKQLNSKSYFSSNIGLNYSKSGQTDYSFDRMTESVYTKSENKVTRTGYNFSSSFNSKINSRLFVKIGIQDELIGLNLYFMEKRDPLSEFKQIWDYNSYTNLAQAYMHAKYSFNDKLTLNAGLHSQLFFLNNSLSVEPRLGLKYEIDSKSSLTFGYGLHSQTQPLNVYFYKLRLLMTPMFITMRTLILPKVIISYWVTICSLSKTGG
ncbi:MAG: TonB-dependent receptor [Bacteroidales bacterium]|nr:TonB-dependent receptor [Bacteroidales bacterium]